MAYEIQSEKYKTAFSLRSLFSGSLLDRNNHHKQTLDGKIKPKAPDQHVRFIFTENSYTNMSLSLNDSQKNFNFGVFEFLKTIPYFFLVCPVKYSADRMIVICNCLALIPLTCPVTSWSHFPLVGCSKQTGCQGNSSLGKKK